MTLNDQKNLFSIAYAYAVAAAAGFNVNGVPVIDDDSVDLTLCTSGARGLTRRPKIDLQLKCSAGLKFVGGDLAFPLRRKNYEDLSAETVCPRYLVVLEVPPDPVDWMNWTQSNLILSVRSFWQKVSARAQLRADQETITVHLPSSQCLDCTQLTQLMEEANRP